MKKGLGISESGLEEIKLVLPGIGLSVKDLSMWITLADEPESSMATEHMVKKMPSI